MIQQQRATVVITHNRQTNALEEHRFKNDEAVRDEFAPLVDSDDHTICAVFKQRDATKDKEKEKDKESLSTKNTSGDSPTKQQSTNVVEVVQTCDPTLGLHLGPIMCDSTTADDICSHCGIVVYKGFESTASKFVNQLNGRCISSSEKCQTLQYVYPAPTTQQSSGQKSGTNMIPISRPFIQRPSWYSDSNDVDVRGLDSLDTIHDPMHLTSSSSSNGIVCAKRWLSARRTDDDEPRKHHRRYPYWLAFGQHRTIRKSTFHALAPRTFVQKQTRAKCQTNGPTNGRKFGNYWAYHRPRKIYKLYPGYLNPRKGLKSQSRRLYRQTGMLSNRFRMTSSAAAAKSSTSAATSTKNKTHKVASLPHLRMDGRKTERTEKLWTSLAECDDKLNEQLGNFDGKSTSSSSSDSGEDEVNSSSKQQSATSDDNNSKVEAKTKRGQTFPFNKTVRCKRETTSHKEKKRVEKKGCPTVDENATTICKRLTFSSSKPTTTTTTSTSTATFTPIPPSPIPTPPPTPTGTTEKPKRKRTATGRNSLLTVAGAKRRLSRARNHDRQIEANNTATTSGATYTSPLALMVAETLKDGPQPIQKRLPSVYDPLSYFVSYIEHLEAIDRPLHLVPSDVDVMGAIVTEANRRGIELTRYTPEAQYRELLKDLNLNRFYPYIPQIRLELTGAEPKRLSVDENMILVEQYKAIRKNWSKIIAHTSRKSMVRATVLYHYLCEKNDFVNYEPVPFYETKSRIMVNRKKMLAIQTTILDKGVEQGLIPIYYGPYSRSHPESHKYALVV
jgi:hypothetical protein